MKNRSDLRKKKNRCGWNNYTRLIKWTVIYLIQECDFSVFRMEKMHGVWVYLMWVSHEYGTATNSNEFLFHANRFVRFSFDGIWNHYWFSFRNLFSEHILEILLCAVNSIVWCRMTIALKQTKLNCMLPNIVYNRCGQWIV